MSNSIKSVIIGALLAFIPAMILGINVGKYYLMKEAESYGYAVKIFSPGRNGVYVWRIVIDNIAKE